MLGLKGTRRIFLKADYDEKYGMALNSIDDLVICAMGYEEFATVWASGIREAFQNTIEDFANKKCKGFKTFDDLIDYVIRHYI
jgi:hypothetical protein